MKEIITSLNSIATNILVWISILIIISGIVHAIFLYTNSKDSKNVKNRNRLMQSIRLVSINIIIVLPLFALKFIHETFLPQSWNTYIVLTMTIVALYLLVTYKYLKYKS